MKCLSLISISSDLNSLLLSFSLDIKASQAFLSQTLQRRWYVRMSTHWTCSARERVYKLPSRALTQYVNGTWNLAPLTVAI